MNIHLKNPATLELREFNRLIDHVKKNHNSSFVSSIDVDGFVFCEGKLIQDGSILASARSFMPIGNNLGYARIMAEILSLAYCLEAIGESIEWLSEDEVAPKVAVDPKVYALTEDVLKGSSSLSECLRKVKDSGYPNLASLEKYLSDIRLTMVEGKTRRATKYDVIEYVFGGIQVSEDAIQVARSGKPLRSGIEWSRVKKLALSLKELPEGFKSADEFANFASKSEVDGIIQLQGNEDNK
jgi:hypothetical protein